MIRHIVMWKVENDKDIQENSLRLKSALLGLKNNIPEIFEMEVGINIGKKSESSCDIVLNSSFKNLADLKTYQNHSEHLRVVKLLRSLTTEKRVVDFEY